MKKKIIIILTVFLCFEGLAYSSDVEKINNSCEFLKSLFGKWQPLQQEKIKHFQEYLETGVNIKLMSDAIRNAKDTYKTYEETIINCNSRLYLDSGEKLNILASISMSATGMLPLLLSSEFDKKIIIEERDAILINYLEFLQTTF